MASDSDKASEKARARRLSSRFNLTVEDYDDILSFQEGVCSICKNPPKSIRLSVDHDHKTGLIRGLLCWHCNAALGKWRDNRDLVLGAAEYVVSPPATQALGREVYGQTGRARTAKKRRKRKPKG